MLDHSNGEIMVPLVELGRADGVKNIPIAVSLSSPVAPSYKLPLGKEKVLLCDLGCFLSYFPHWFTSCSLLTVAPLSLSPPSLMPCQDISPGNLPA